MVFCPKCGVRVEKPVKSWKMKQTPVALYECQSCKAKWRSKNFEAEEAEALAEVKPPVKTEVSISVEPPVAGTAPPQSVLPELSASTLVVPTNVDVPAAAPSLEAQPLGPAAPEETTPNTTSSIRRFFSYLLEELLK